MIPPTFEERFFAKIVKGQSKDDCWGWTACKNNKGYGTIRMNRKMEVINRASWIVHFGGIPKGMHVLHTCDNPICCNPKHLWLGTHQDNMNDMITKGRDNKDVQKALRNRKVWLKGEDVGNSKLTNDKVRWIKSEARNRKVGFVTQMAKRYRVSVGAISHIINGRSWTHI